MFPAGGEANKEQLTAMIDHHEVVECSSTAECSVI
jgi:hypothetical protein